MGLKLNQVIAIEKGLKERTLREVTNLYHAGQKSDPFNGFTRTYTPSSDSGEQIPAETKAVQSTAISIVSQTLDKMKELFNVTASKDRANCNARASVVVEGETLLTDVPVTHLLFLEQQVSYVRTVLDKLPTLSPDDKWTFDENSQLFSTSVVKSLKTAKIQEPMVLIQPTKEHPGQAQLVTRDVTVGTWEMVKVSGALPIPVKAKLLDRVDLLLQAIKFAREEANMIDVSLTDDSSRLLAWISRGVK